MSIDPRQFDKDTTPEVSFESKHSAPDGSGRHGRFELWFSLESWSRQRRVIKAWEALAARQGLDAEMFRAASWSFVDGIMSIQHQVVLDTNKTQTLGFFGHVDSSKEFCNVFRRAEELKLLPSSQKE